MFSDYHPYIDLSNHTHQNSLFVVLEWLCVLHDIPPTATADFVPATQTITFPVSTTVSRVCTSFQITNDTIALEGNEQFRVDFTVPAGTQTGVIDTACVTIIDDDGTGEIIQLQETIYLNIS